MARAVSDQVARAVELYGLGRYDDAELARLLRNMTTKESDQYYREIRTRRDVKLIEEIMPVALPDPGLEWP